MLDELDKLIVFINNEYNNYCEKWKNSKLYIPINQKNTLVKNIEKNNNIFNSILNYRLFINEYHFELKIKLSELNIKSEISSRVKARNSIEYKIRNYMSEKHNCGEVPINKCFNDLYGIRIIMKDNISYDEIKKFVENRYNTKLKCIDSSNGEYVATHIYFKENNFSYQWELQIFDREHEKTNIISHEKYKQDYTKWEKENKGGKSL